MAFTGISVKALLVILSYGPLTFSILKRQKYVISLNFDFGSTPSSQGIDIITSCMLLVRANFKRLVEHIAYGLTLLSPLVLPTETLCSSLSTSR